MPKSCCAVGCKNHNLMLKRLSFFRFPRNADRQIKWLAALKRDKPDGTPWVPTKHSVICSEHFITGKPNEDHDHPDYVPSVFSFAVTNTKTVQQKKIERYENVAKRKIHFTSPDLAVKRVKFDQNLPTPETCIMYEATPCSPLRQKKENIATSPLSPMPYLNHAFMESPARGTSAIHRPVPSSEREMIYSEMDNLRSERDRLIQENDKLSSQITTLRLSSSITENNDVKSNFYTGLKWDVFLSVFTFLQTFMTRTPLASKLALRDQFFVTLVKLKLDMPFEYIADQCGIPSSTLHDMFWRWIDLMSTKLDFLIHWPDRETMKRTLPSVFKVKYPRLTCIIDCFEIFIDRPKKLNARAKCYSNYKKHSTVKVLIGCSPLGSITFLSEVWGGRVSDTEIVRSSGFISSIYHHPGDQILADRGFTLQDDFASVCSAELIIPAFTKGKSQLSAEEVETSRKMSSIRIHIERVIGLMKNRYKILQGTIPINMLKSTTDEASTKKQARIDKLVRICGSLTNMGEGIVYNEESD
ncbi:uncharacterized protein LOC134696404 [Mytilus trossulus]